MGQIYRLKLLIARESRKLGSNINSWTFEARKCQKLIQLSNCVSIFFQVGTAFTSDINAFTTFLEEYQTALDSPIQVSSLRPYQPGSLLTKFPFPPEKSSTTTAVLKQLIVDILRHSTHWQHPRYFGPNGPGRSVPDVAAHLFLPFLSPTIIELEKKTMSFLKKALEIPSEYAKEALVESATEAVYHVLLMARSRMLDKLFEIEEAPGKMVAYCSTSVVYLSFNLK